MDQKCKTVAEIKEELDRVAGDMVGIMECLEVLEHSIYFLSERKDKDMSKPCAAAAEVILKMVDGCQDALMVISEELEIAAEKGGCGNGRKEKR